MKPLSEIHFGFSDAENYKRREEKELFSKIFLRTDAMEQLRKPSTFFLVGEKGTGKTAYAVHFTNGQFDNNRSDHRFIRETDYQKFIALKKDSHLSVSDYEDIWKVIIYLLMANSLIERDKAVGELLQYPKFAALKKVIEEYYQHAFSPEIRTAMQFVEDSTRAAELLVKYMPLQGKITDTDRSVVTSETTRFQLNLLYIERTFRDALSSLKLGNNQLLFIDGIDIRPPSIPYAEYLDCVKGLGNAIWSLNNDVFPTFRDSKGRLRAIMLVRPDIFNSLGLQNRNTKLKDNSVVLGWLTNYGKYRSSEIFALADRMFGAQQAELMKLGQAWDYYFPFDAKTVDTSQGGDYSAFVTFLRYSFYRPRDILTALDILREQTKADVDAKGRVFTYDDVMATSFKTAYGTYLLGEIRDALSFYYDEEEYELFLKFFEYLNGARNFSYPTYLQAFAGFSKFLEQQTRPRPGFMKSPEEFLQFLYDQNVLCYKEHASDEKFIRWCFRERTISNPSPKVKTELEYEIHYGLSNVLNTGKALAVQKPNDSAESKFTNFGKVIQYDASKGFGFILQEGLPVDVYFRAPAQGVGPRKGDAVRYILSKDHAGRLIAKDVRTYKK
jgi:cold shock CspA family protein